MQNPKNDTELLEILADAAGSTILPHFRALPGIENKASEGFDPVTVADRAAEQAIRKLIEMTRPGDGIVGEEFAPVPSTNGRRWVIDPIDGTRGFLAGLPTWGTLIALAEGDEITFGVMDQPYVGERFIAGPDGVFHRRGETQTPLKTRPCARLEDAIVACTASEHLDPALREALEQLSGRVRMIRYGTDCYGYALLAAGHIDICLEGGLKNVDIAPFVPMIERAGGALVDRTGARLGTKVLDEDYGGDGIAVGDPALLPELVRALS